jgi:hypothetical protein
MKAFLLLLLTPVTRSFHNAAVPSRRPYSIILRQAKKASNAFFLEATATTDDEPSMDLMEKQVLASAQSQLDEKRFVSALLDKSTTDNLPAERWQIALAAGTVGFLFVFLTTGNINLALIVLAGFYWSANRDPLDEQEDISGPLARIVGRATLSSGGTVRTVARAVVKDQEGQVKLLEKDINNLKQENEKLKLWQERRIKVDGADAKLFTVPKLKEQARANGLKVGGTKTELLFRLVEAGVIDL